MLIHGAFRSEAGVKRRLTAAATSLVLIMAVALAAAAWCMRGHRCAGCRRIWWSLVPFANETGNIAFSLAHGDGFCIAISRADRPDSLAHACVSGAGGRSIFKILRNSHGCFALWSIDAEHFVFGGGVRADFLDWAARGRRCYRSAGGVDVGGAADGDHHPVPVGVGYVARGAARGADRGGDAFARGDVGRVGLRASYAFC